MEWDDSRVSFEQVVGQMQLADLVEEEKRRAVDRKAREALRAAAGRPPGEMTASELLKADEKDALAEVEKAESELREAEDRRLSALAASATKTGKFPPPPSFGGGRR